MKIGEQKQKVTKGTENLLCMWFWLLLSSLTALFSPSSSWFAYKTVSNAPCSLLFSLPTFPLFAYSNVLTSWKNNTNVGEFSNIYCVKKVIRKTLLETSFLYGKPSPFWCQGQENWHFSNLSSQWCDDMDMGNCCHCIYALSYATNSTAQTQIPNSFKHWKNEPLAMLIKVLW